MKKILFAAVALVAMASCATDEVVMRPENKLAIEFDNAFVENSTRAADITASNLSAFGVYGSISNANNETGLTFDYTMVSKDGDVYKYSPAQVWANNATYTFVAFAPAAPKGDNDTWNNAWSYDITDDKQAYNGVITFNNEAAQANQDLLFASEKRITEVINSKPEAVALTFNHMLSRVKFHFTNNFHDGSNVDLKVTNVTITDAHSTGTLAVNDGQVADDWTVGTATFSRNFGDVKTPLRNTTLDENGGNGETEHFYLIPTAAEYNVEFDVKMTVAGGASFDYHHTAVLNINMEKGHSYVVKTALNQTNTDPQGEMYAIEFKVEKVEEWENFEDEKLNTSIGGEVENCTLFNDAKAESTVVVKGTLNGGGNTIAVEQGTQEFYANNMLTFINLKHSGASIDNITIDGNNASWYNTADGKTYGIRNINITAGGEYTINNVTSVEASYPLHVSTTAPVTLNVSNSTMEGWLSYNSATTATFKNVEFTKNTTKDLARLRPYGTTVCENCNFAEGYVIDLKYLADGKTITFKNCKVNGVALNESHLTDAVAGKYTIQ